jgi:hypothetical protein
LWSCLVNFSGFAQSGSASVRVRAVDEHGNASAFSNPITLIVDGAAPTVTLDSSSEAALADGFITASEAILRGLVVDDQRADRVKICTQQPAKPDVCTTQKTQPQKSASGQWANQLFVDNLDGITQTLRLVGIDSVGNQSAPLERTFRIDTVPPVVTATASAAGISGTVSDGSGVQIVRLRVEPENGAPYWLDAQQDGDQWALTFQSALAGKYTLFVEAVDLVGNLSATGPFVVVGSGAGEIYLPVIMREGSPGSHQIYLPAVNN